MGISPKVKNVVENAIRPRRTRGDTNIHKKSCVKLDFNELVNKQKKKCFVIEEPLRFFRMDKKLLHASDFEEHAGELNGKQKYFQMLFNNLEC